jgi:hypothetical protein
VGSNPTLSATATDTFKRVGRLGFRLKASVTAIALSGVESASDFRFLTLLTPTNRPDSQPHHLSGTERVDCYSPVMAGMGDRKADYGAPEVVERIDPAAPARAAKAREASAVAPAGERRRAVVQAKLSVGPANDPYEKEADAVAARVVRSLRAQRSTEVPATTQPVASRVQRAATKSDIGVDGGDLDASTERIMRSESSKGQPLPDAAKSKMEGAFGADFSGIRVHAGAAATDLNDRIQAKAFTTGNDIFFRDGLPDTSSPGGQSLLAHELTHTMQQGAANHVNRSTENIQREFDMDGINKLEQDAKKRRMDVVKAEYMAQKQLYKAGGSDTQLKDDWWVATDRKWYPPELYPANRTEAETGADATRSSREASATRSRREDSATRRHEARSKGTSDPEGEDSLAMESLDSVSGTVGKTAEISDLSGVGGLMGAQHEGRSSWGAGAPEGENSVLINSGGGSPVGGHNMVEGMAGYTAGLLTVADRNARTDERAVAGVNAAGYASKALSGAAAAEEATATSAAEVAEANGTDAGGLKAAAGDWSAHSVMAGQGSDGFLGIGQAGGAALKLREAYDASKQDSLNDAEKALLLANRSAGAVADASTAVASWSKVVGAGGVFDLAKEVGQATAVAAAFGIVAGVFEMAAGGYAVYKSGGETKELKKSMAILNQGRRKLAAADPAMMSAVELSEAKRLGQAIEDNLVTLGHLIGMKVEASSAGKKQAAGGAVAVVGGVLTLTGVGLPIVLSVAVAGALLKLGFIGAQMRRNSKTSKWIEMAKSLNDDGGLRAKPKKDEKIGFSEMKARFLKAYYKAPMDRDAAGLKSKHPKLGHAVRQFGRSMKLKEIGKKTAENTREISTLRPAEYPLYWLEHDQAKMGPAPAAAGAGDKEKHTGEHSWGDFFKWDVTRSKDAKSAAKTEVVNALNYVAWNTFQKAGTPKDGDPARFDTKLGVVQVAPLTPQDRDDLGPADEARLNSLTDDVLLSVTGLKGKAKQYGEHLKGPPEKDQEAMRAYVEPFAK